ncbi:alpha/beta fold hydrolase [Camelliibacillus cellulosilyticus]|uniref:Alpha/beta fold hydrolase n=1 Tax=Camelliibacillus cellulosilyticus TaxID=2174486 RepID=A0ABV9GRK5_9BACL
MNQRTEMKTMNHLQNQETFIELNGVRHWVKVEGAEHQTNPMILIHGGPGGNHYTFERTAGRALARHFTLIYYEQRGSGRSDQAGDWATYTIPYLTQDLRALLDYFAIEKADLLGYSFGGELALEFALAYPDRVSQLILLGPSIGDHETTALVQLLGFEEIADGRLREIIADLRASGKPPIEVIDDIWQHADVQNVDRLLFQDQSLAKQNRDLWEESHLENTGEMARALQKWPMPTPLKERVSAIKQPTLIITGLHDRNTGLLMSRYLLRKIPQSQLLIFNDSAHFPDIEETESLVQAVLRFLSP